MRTSELQQVALVTGGTSGIGYALTEQLLASGWHVVVAARQLDRLAQLQARYPTALTPLPLDLRSPDSVAALAQAVGELQPPVSTVVLNAGLQHNYDIGAGGPAEADQLDEELQVNLTSKLHLVRMLLPRLLAQPRASLVLVTSGLALVPKPQAAVYCATKAALRAYGQSLAWQVKDRLHLMEVVLPVVDTPMTKGRGRNKLSPEAAASAILTGIRQRKQGQLLVGRTKLLYILHRLWPGLARRIMERISRPATR